MSSNQDRVPPPESGGERRRTLANAFDDAPPGGTRDEDPEGWGEREHTDDDEWLLREVPPHHG